MIRRLPWGGGLRAADFSGKLDQVIPPGDTSAVYVAVHSIRIFPAVSANVGIRPAVRGTVTMKPQ